MSQKSMKELVIEFPNQLSRAIEIARSKRLSKAKKIKNVLISGLGGSGIGATIVSNWVNDKAKIPISINKGYFLPNYVDKNTLVICCSYSGNTEETVKVLHDSHKAKAHIVCISSGGQMIDYCRKHNLDYILIDGGMPPRSCLGYSIVQLVHVLEKYKVIPDKYTKKIKNSIEFLIKNQKDLDQKALELAKKISHKIPVLYSEDRFEGVAVRYRQQLNENSKMLCWHHVIPEMNHNEMVGWREKNDQLAVIFLNNSSDYERNKFRKDLSKGVISKYTNTIIEIDSKGENIIEESFYHIHFCDLLSCHLADIRKYDASEIDVVNELKGALDQKPLFVAKAKTNDKKATKNTMKESKASTKATAKTESKGTNKAKPATTNKTAKTTASAKTTTNTTKSNSSPEKTTAKETAPTTKRKYTKRAEVTAPVVTESTSTPIANDNTDNQA